MFKVKNVVILAAGRGSRMLDLTCNIPKPLLKGYNDKSFIENIIEMLLEKNIYDITIVTGYLAEQFNFLVDKYKVKLVHNEHWNKSNNISSLNKVINEISNTLVINGDIVLEENLFKAEYECSLTYVENNEDINEWIVNVNNHNQVLSYDKKGLSKKGLYQREITFIDERLGFKLKKDIEKFDINEYQEFFVLETAQKNNLPFKIFEVAKNKIYDLDNKEDYLEFQNNLN